MMDRSKIINRIRFDLIFVFTLVFISVNSNAQNDNQPEQKTEMDLDIIDDPGQLNCDCITTFSTDTGVFYINVYNLSQVPESTISDFVMCPKSGVCEGRCSWVKTPPGGDPVYETGHCLPWAFGDKIYVFIEHSGGGREGKSILESEGYLVDIEALPEIDLYPNPASKSFTVKSDFPVEIVRIYDTSGRLVITSESNVVDINGVDSGMYIVHIETNKGIVVKQLIKN